METFLGRAAPCRLTRNASSGKALTGARLPEWIVGIVQASITPQEGENLLSYMSSLYWQYATGKAIGVHDQGLQPGCRCHSFHSRYISPLCLASACSPCTIQPWVLREGLKIYGGRSNTRSVNSLNKSVIWKSCTSRNRAASSFAGHSSIFGNCYPVRNVFFVPGATAIPRIKAPHTANLVTTGRGRRAAEWDCVLALGFSSAGGAAAESRAGRNRVQRDRNCPAVERATASSTSSPPSRPTSPAELVVLARCGERRVTPGAEG